MHPSLVRLFGGLSATPSGDPTGRLTAIAFDLVNAGWYSCQAVLYERWREIARVTVGGVPAAVLRDGGAGVARLTFNALRKFERNGALVVDAARLTEIAPYVETKSGARDLVFFPLEAAGDVIGLLCLEPGEPRFGDDELAAFGTYASVAATILEAERRCDRFAGDAERSGMLARIGEHMRTTLDRNEMLEHVARDVRAAFDAAHCAIYVRGSDPRFARRVASDRIGAPPSTPDGGDIMIEGTHLYRCLTLGQVVRVERISASVEDRALSASGTQAALIVPIFAEGRVDAGMTVEFAEPHEFEEIDLIMLRSIASHAGLALANARLFDLERIRRHRAESLERNVRALTEMRDVREILQLSLDMIAPELGATGSAWALEDGELSCLAVAQGRPGERGSIVGATVAVTPELDAVLVAGELVAVPGGSSPAHDIFANKSGYFMPLRSEGRPWGMLALAGDARVLASQDERNFVRTVVAHVSLAMANARTFDEERRNTFERAALSEAGRIMLAFNRLEPLAEAVTRLALRLMGCELAALYLPQDERLRRIGCATGENVRPFEKSLPLADPLIGAAYRSGETVVYAHPVAELPYSGYEAVAHAVLLPLRAAREDGTLKPEPAGVFACMRTLANPAPFTVPEVRLLDALGSLLALGLRNVDLYESVRVANGALAESNEFKDDLLAMFTHDFKGPLTIILGHVELLLETEQGELRDILETIFNQGKRLAKLAEDALVLARTQAAGFSLQRTLCDLVQFVRDDAAVLNRGSRRVHVRTSAQPIYVFIDRTRMRHVFDNVIGNALKYSSSDVEVDIDCVGDMARVRVADFGIGIPAQEVERIFIRFGRGSNARMKGIAGSGVGLYVGRKIVDVHGGRISVDSRENEGSTFTIEIPAIDQAEALERLAAGPASSAATSPALTG